MPKVFVFLAKSMKRLFIYGLVTIVFATSAAAADGIVEIVTNEEASQPNARVVGKASAAELTDGPFINFNKPTSGSEVPKPVTIDISFKQHSAPIDVSTLKVTYLKLFNIDITESSARVCEPLGNKESQTPPFRLALIRCDSLFRTPRAIKAKRP